MTGTWFITGISRGLGREMATQLLKRGATVAGTVRDPASVADLRTAHREHLWVGQLELADPAAIRRVVDRAFNDVGPVDVVVNNAGYGVFGAIEELSDEQIRGVLDTNVIGSLQVARAALPHLRRQGSGRILQVSSYGGQVARPGAALYNASKWCIEAFMEALQQELVPFGIGVTLVEPGVVRTEFRGRSELAQPLAAYDGTPAAALRGLREASPGPGDPVRIAAAMIESAQREPAPRRLVLGSDSYAFMHEALTERLAELEAQRENASTTDWRGEPG
ncbi:SDR family oxidoreductase [Amycolatopsis jejuensis]|uniref:SDR family oxidoreductase n=1 Tax=Amycolatopsis jejuensis TaxID=330084 RepID=UPI000526801B|nr:SDR family oxidoreductase [Amycolatopsis jejuensis]